jgi:hypothetical protein
MRRRNFIQRLGWGAAAAGMARHGLGSGSNPQPSPASEWHADVVIVGGGVGGCAAALAAARNGLHVILTEETEWIGGQFTSRAVPPDEHPWIESCGATRSYRDFRARVRDYYRRNYPLTPEARAVVALNPGNGGVSRLCHEPRVALAVLGEMLAPHLSAGRLSILLHHKPVAADVKGDEVIAVTVENLRSGRRVVLEAPWFVDATELGDLLPLAGVEYVTGGESRAQTGELHAPESPAPQNMQGFTFCFAMDYLEGEDHTIAKPESYGFWRDYRPELKPPWPGRLLDWTWSEPITLKSATGYIDPSSRERRDGKDLWFYRRIADRQNFASGAYASDITLVNWPQNDYWLGSLIDVPAPEAAKHVRQAKELSLSLLYWLQTEAPRPDGGAGWRGLRLRGDLVGTEDGLAMAPYIREARRIKAELTVLEQHVGVDARAKLTGAKREDLTAEPFPDSVGVGSYRIDLHPSTGGNNYIDVASLPFQIPLGALIPRRVENLLPAAKNLGVTHITNGCYRLHHVEWNIGEAVGLLAAFCKARNVLPRQVRNQPRRLGEFQDFIQAQGVEIRWPNPLPRTD